MYRQGEKRLRKLNIMSLQRWNIEDVVLALQPSEVRKHVTQAMKAQVIWVWSSFKQRWQFPWIFVKYIIEHQELVCEISSLDTGKTMVGASLEEIMAIREKITQLLSEGEKWLKPEYWPTRKLMLHKTTEKMVL